jgi:hypothetical protein
MATWNKVYSSSNRWIYFAIFLFIAITWITFWLFYQNNNFLSDKIISLKTEKQEKIQTLEKLKKDNILQVFSLLKANRKEFEKKAKLSDITFLINKIEDLWLKYDLNFKSFSYSKWKVSLKAESVKWFNGKASKKTSKFIWDFRNKIINENWKQKIMKPKIEEFSLDFIK